MRTGTYNLPRLLFLVTYSVACFPFIAAAPSSGPDLSKRQAAPPPAPAVVDNTYLPAQIGGIAGSYALSLVLVAILLLALAKKRREHLTNGEDVDGLQEPTFNPFPQPFLLHSEEEYKQHVAAFPYPVETPRSPLKNFSHPLTSPRNPIRVQTNLQLPPPTSPHTFPSPISTISHPASGVDLTVDQSIVARDREMAQQQLEDMYKYVMEQEEAKQAGKEYEGPSLPASPQSKSSMPGTPITPGTLRKEKNKPSNLNLSKEPKAKSNSMLSFLKSPRQKMKGVSISSPIMTPMSGTFPRQESQELSSIPPRHYAPAPPPPVPTDVLPFRRQQAGAQLPTPEMSPTANPSIDAQIDAAFGQPPTRDEYSRYDRRERRPSQTHSRDPSTNTAYTRRTDGEDSDSEPLTATTMKSTSHLVGLPTSPKPGVNRFPSLSELPKSPVPGQSFPRFNAPSAVRTGGALPLRAYEPGLKSPSQVSETTKQTVFTRAGPLSPGMTTGMRTPWTGAPVPYTPYQPFSPVVPITPSLVTKADRKRMRKLEPKTPTVEMVRSSDDMW